MPKVSVIIPVYNVEEYLPECLDSVVNQTLKDIEIICIDDGSTDNSLEILKEYAQRDSRIRILTQKNQGAGAARNKGLEVAKGEYVHFLDSDDWLELYAYEDLYNLGQEKKVNVLKFRSYSFDNIEKSVRSTYYTDAKGVNEKYFDNYLLLNEDIKDMINLPDSPWSGFYKRSFLSANNIYFDKLVCVNDFGFFIRCIIKAYKIYFSSKRYIFYRENVKNSLIARRAKHFDCQTKLYSIVNNEIKYLPEDIRYEIINKVIKAAFGWYKNLITNNKSDYKIQKKINGIMKKFLREIAKEKLSDRNKSLYAEIKGKIAEEQKTIAKKQIEKIFSIKNKGNHKVINVVGIKIKFKSQKLIYKAKIDKLEKRVKRLEEKLKEKEEKCQKSA